MTILTRRCTEPLKLIRSVASQFRAAPPKSTAISPSYFIPSVLRPLRELLSTNDKLAAQYGTGWSTQVVDAVFGNYANILASVRKTEDLLRRHRKSKKTGFSLFGNPKEADGAVDNEEERFRAQMRMDIDTLRSEAEVLKVNVSSLGSWKELEEVVDRPAE